MTPQQLVDRLRAAGCVFAEEEAKVLLDTAASPAQLETMTARRVAGEPLEYIVGWAEFFGLRIGVAPGVFVPRARTEFLVAEAIKLTPGGALVVDLCCGTGSLGLALAASVPGLELVAADIDPVAVECARRNGVDAYVGDLFDALPVSARGRVNTLLANTPYVPTGELEFMPREARLYEAPATLDGGFDGLDLQRRIAADAGSWLAPGGSVLVEASSRQAEVSAAIFADAGLEPSIRFSEEWDATVVVGRRPQ